MKAIVVEKPFEIAVREAPMPQIRGEDEVLVRVLSGGICGSDIGIYNGTNALATYPRIIGHEFGGRVVETGGAVTGVQAGDVVAVDPVRACGRCYACRVDRHNVCREVEVVGVHRDGGFAEYVVAPAADCYKIDTAKIPAEMACMVEPYSIGLQVNYRAAISRGEDVLVMGAGPIGISVLQMARARGARVMVTDLVPERLERALACGAERAVHVQKENLERAVRDFTGGEGAPVVVDTVCSLNSVPQAMDLACPAGRVVVLGLKDAPSSIAQVAFTKKELTVLGSRLNNHRFSEVILMLEQGRLQPEQMCTQTFPFADVAEAIRLIQEHPETVCKVNLTFT